ncbi:hypothetical protein ZWY2020_011403 [Hordeum vulgare]|nr:hypothetical protein ZWY2020_011403 [Hordeum vulgare]
MWGKTIAEEPNDPCKQPQRLPSAQYSTSLHRDEFSLLTDGRKIWAWSKQTARWQQQPEAVIDEDAISRFLDKEGRGNNPVIMREKGTLGLVCFAERSGIVLITSGCTFFWLDLRSMEIVRCFSDSRLQDMNKNIPMK